MNKFKEGTIFELDKGKDYMIVDSLNKGENEYLFSGGADLEDFFDLFGEEIEADCNTVNGWAMIELDRLPKEGDEFDFESRHKIFHVRVIKADSRRALMTRIKVEDKPDEDD